MERFAEKSYLHVNNTLYLDHIGLKVRINNIYFLQSEGMKCGR